MISVVIGYLVNHIVSTKFSIDIAPLFSYCVISNHPVTGSIMVTAFRSKFYFFPYLLMTYGPTIYTHCLFHDIYSASLAGNLPYFIFDNFVNWRVSQFLTYFQTESIMMCQYKIWKIIASFISITGRMR